MVILYLKTFNVFLKLKEIAVFIVIMMEKKQQNIYKSNNDRLLCTKTNIVALQFVFSSNKETFDF